MIKYFCCSDIHSFFEEWMDALTENGFELNNPDHHIVICGDLFDRGPDAVKCYEFVKTMTFFKRCHYVRGNHEDLLCDFYHDLKYQNWIGHHHFSNGTVDTVVQLLGLSNKYDLLHNLYSREHFEKSMTDILDFFQDNCVDYFEAGDHIFVHGWVPCTSEDKVIYHGQKEFNSVYPEWPDNFDTVERDKMWEAARWINGMLAWAQGMRLEGKTIVCGHWHASFGNSRIHGHGEEFGPTACFDTFIDKGIVALDGCTAISGKVNCYVLEVDN